jgi:hypothetical protein
MEFHIDEHFIGTPESRAEVARRVAALKATQRRGYRRTYRAQKRQQEALNAQQVLDEVDDFLREGRRLSMLNRPKQQQEEEAEIIIDEPVSWCYEMLCPERAWLWLEECYVANKVNPGRGFDPEG